MKTYKWREGAPQKLCPQVAGEEIERLYQQHETLTAPIVVDAARPAAAPLHPAFEWQDKVAGERWREHQARNLIRQIQVVHPDQDEPQPQSIHVTGGDAGYKPLAVVVGSPDMYARAIEELQSKIAGLERAMRSVERAAGEAGLDNATEIRLALAALKSFEKAVGAIRH